MKRRRAVARGCREYIDKRPRNLHPLYEEDDVEEMRRLINREIPTDPVFQVNDFSCLICFGKDHDCCSCPCLSSMSKDVVLHSTYDKICLDCGTIGMDDCHDKGFYAFPKMCSFCTGSGHWYWEDKCSENFRLDTQRRLLWESLKDGNPLPKYPLQIPTLGYPMCTPETEILRLMNRKNPHGHVDDGCCKVCCEESHPDYQCPWLRSIPEGKILGPEFDEVCIGCGKIGMRDCGMGAYAIPKVCIFCRAGGHWFWEEKCIDCSPKWLAKWVTFKKSITIKGPSIEGSPRTAFPKVRLIWYPIKDRRTPPHDEETMLLRRSKIPRGYVDDDSGRESASNTIAFGPISRGASSA